MVRAAERAVSDRRFTGVRDQAVNELHEAETRVGRLRLRLDGTPADLRLRVAGRAAGPSEVAEEVLVPAGSVEVRATAESYEPFHGAHGPRQRDHRGAGRCSFDADRSNSRCYERQPRPFEPAGGRS